MRSCKKCFEYVYVFVGGDVRMCPWNGVVIGNLLENTLEEIWKSEKAEEVRRAFMRGELLGCSERFCPDCIQKKTRLEMEPEEVQSLYDNMPNLPTRISLAYDERCNHACPSCRHDFFKADCEYMSKLDLITKNIEPYLSNAIDIATNGIGDLFVSTEIVDMLSRFEPKSPDFKLFIETNGVLFKKNWDKLKHLAGKNITVSVTPNSFDRETYRYLAGRDDLEQFEESLAFITELKHQGAISKIRLIMVIQDSNFRQIPQFIQKGIDYDCDDIVLRPIFKWFGMNEDEVLYKNVLNPAHPYYKEYMEIIQDPICQDPRVFNWGFQEEQEAIEFPTLEMKREWEQLRIFRGEYDKNCEFESDVIARIDRIRDRLTGKKIVIFGAGKAGKILLEAITSGQETADVAGFAVTCKDCNDNYYMGVPIRGIDEYSNWSQYTVVIATVIDSYREEMVETCKTLGINDYIELN